MAPLGNWHKFVSLGLFICDCCKSDLFFSWWSELVVSCKEKSRIKKCYDSFHDSIQNSLFPLSIFLYNPISSIVEH